MFVGAVRGEGVSTVSREFARLAAVRATKPVWLIDADLHRQGQQQIMMQAPDRFGRAGETVAGSPDGSSFYSIKPPLIDPEGERVRPARLLTAKSFLGRRLYATRFLHEQLKAGQNAQSLKQGDYWVALSQHVDAVIVDVPSLDRDETALMLAPFMDDIVIVVGENADIDPPLKLKEQLLSVGGRVSGVVINRSTYKPPKLIKKLMG